MYKSIALIAFLSAAIVLAVPIRRDLADLLEIADRWGNESGFWPSQITNETAQCSEAYWNDLELQVISVISLEPKMRTWSLCSICCEKPNWPTVMRHFPIPLSILSLIAYTQFVVMDCPGHSISLGGNSNTKRLKYWQRPCCRILLLESPLRKILSSRHRPNKARARLCLIHLMSRKWMISETTMWHLLHNPITTGICGISVDVWQK